MCGICGFIGFSKPLVDEATLWAMTKVLDHRGPDDAGIFHSGCVGLGHTRLSIIDLSQAGHQPMFSHDRSVVVVYNGELYNYSDLRRRLMDKGRVFMSNTDTEVVLQSYMEWGPDIFSGFDGMFACAIWDEREQSLHVLRDRFGIKPLYYCPSDSGVVFGSEIKALLASGTISKEVNEQGLHEYMWYGNALGENTLFKGIFKLLPGHYMTVRSNKINVRQYWKIEDTEQLDPGVRDATDTVLEILEASVKNHLMSDVPVGVFLSGGVDSSAITALASRHYRGRLKTFSVGFEFAGGMNELPGARNVAELFDTEHNELYISGADLPDVIESLVQCHDEPFADAANIPLYLLCRELKGSIKVILQGDGGDEIFAGYRRYHVLAHRQLWYFISILALCLQTFLPKGSHYYRYKRFFYAMKQDAAMSMALLLTRDSMIDSPTGIFRSDIQQAMSQYDPFSNYKYWNSVLKKFSPVQRMLYTDCMIQLPNTFLEKVDKPAMANSIEARVPFLDNNLTNYVLGLPSEFKVRSGSKKWILKHALKGVLPDNILHAQKRGFSVPVDDWLKGPLADYMRAVLVDTGNRNFFKRTVLETKIDEHISGKKNNGFILWKAMNLAIWFDKYLHNSHIFSV